MYHLAQAIFAYTTLAICFLAACLVFYWQFIQPDDILDKTNESVIINNSGTNEVIAGKPMTVHRSFCIINNQHSGLVTRTFSNHVIYQLPDTTTLTQNRSLGCYDKKYVVDVPEVLPSGDYDYNVRISYKINPIKTVHYNLTPVKLKVVNALWDRVRDLVEENKK